MASKSVLRATLMEWLEDQKEKLQVSNADVQQSLRIRFPTASSPFDPYWPPRMSTKFFTPDTCDLNEDEFGRPYFGPYDEYISHSSSSPFQKLTIAKAQQEIVRRLPPMDSYRRKLERMTESRQSENLDLQYCVSSNECSTEKETCEVSGTTYDSCGRRCTCVDGFLEDCCRVRKEWRSMTWVERCRYIEVVKIASTTQPWKNCYDELITTHRVEFNNQIHDQIFFLPWHRWFILALENLFRKIDCSVTIPYWDWSLEYDTWTESIVWASHQCGMGGDGTGWGNAVETGPFRRGEWELTPSADISFLTRRFNGNVSDCASVALVQKIGVTEFDTWHQIVEGNLHDTVHCRIGGIMCAQDSANAPEFFLHHGFIDKIWKDWQDKGPEYKHLRYYTDNNDPMPSAYNITPHMIYDLTNQPGCVKICIQDPSHSCSLANSFTSFTSACVTEMKSKDYSPVKLADLIPRPFPMPSEESFDLFHTNLKERIRAYRFVEILNDNDKLYNILKSQGFAGLSEFRPVNNAISFSQPLDQLTDAELTEIPDVCKPYILPFL